MVVHERGSLSPARGLCLAALLSAGETARARAQEGRAELELAVRRYLCAEEADAGALREVTKLARGRETLLAEIVKSKSFVPRTDAVAALGVIDAQYRFVAGSPAQNPAMLYGPATAEGLHPLALYVPDDVDSSGREAELAKDGSGRGWFVLLVPDEKQDNLWDPSRHEHRRHVGPLRELLLNHPIDPDRVYMIGSGRGGHATWDVGLLNADRWAALYPCNGGLMHEGGYPQSGGVFLENARCLAVFTVYNTSFDHGIESCRYAARRFREWGYRFESVEEPDLRTMGLAEAIPKVASVTRDSHPRSILKRFNHLEDGEHYWLRALDRKPREWDPSARISVRGKWPEDRDAQLEILWGEVRKACASLEGSVRENRIEIRAHGIGRLRVYFDPELVDYGSKATVVINGKVQKPIALTMRPEIMLQHVRETGDTSRLYWASVDCAVVE